jgi:hypothetical protein
MYAVDYFNMFFYKDYSGILHFMNDRSTAACAPFLREFTQIYKSLNFQ